MRWHVFCQADPFDDIAFYPYRGFAQSFDVLVQRLQDRDVLRTKCVSYTCFADILHQRCASTCSLVLPICVSKVGQTCCSTGGASLGFVVATFRRRVLDGGARGWPDLITLASAWFLCDPDYQIEWH